MSGADDRWADYLGAGEKLIWSGAPGRASVVQYLVTDVFFLAAMAGVMWAVRHASSTGDIKPLVIFWVSSVGAAGYALLFFLFVTGAHRIEYAVTNKRILILRKIGPWWLKSYPITQKTEVRRGDLFQGVWFARMSFLGGSFPPRFLGIDDETYFLLEDQIAEIQDEMMQPGKGGIEANP